MIMTRYEVIEIKTCIGLLESLIEKGEPMGNVELLAIKNAYDALTRVNLTIPDVINGKIMITRLINFILFLCYLFMVVATLGIPSIILFGWDKTEKTILKPLEYFIGNFK